MDSIVICMGSSCYLRGNGNNLQVIQKYLSSNNLSAKVEIRGCLCKNKCNDGPIVVINGTKYNEINENSITELLNHHLIKENR